MEIRNEAKVIMVDLLCPACGKGRLEAKKEAGMRCSNPPQWLHKCTECPHTQWIVGHEPYPHIVYERVPKP
jgi:hypothetical protein